MVHVPRQILIRIYVHVNLDGKEIIVIKILMNVYRIHASTVNVRHLNLVHINVHVMMVGKVFYTV